MHVMRHILVFSCVLFPSLALAGGFGVVHGSVSFEGNAPRKWLNRNSDPVCSKIKRKSDSIVVTKGKLRDVHVRIAGSGLPRPTSKLKRRPVVVKQSQCMYEPKVVSLLPGQRLVVQNVDPTYHNVHAKLKRRTKWNIGQAAGAPDLIKQNISKPGQAITLGCDVHPWMSAYVVTWANAFSKVTSSDGAFAIPDVPVGTYDIEAWHPTLGLLKKRVTVKPGSNEINFTFRKKKN